MHARRPALALLTFAALLPLAGCADPGEGGPVTTAAFTPVRAAPTGDVVAAAATSADLSTFRQALEAARLSGTLSEGGPYTIFAPSNEAFAKLPEGTRGDLMQPENRGMLATILTYHVVSGEHTMREFAGRQVSLPTLQGKDIDVDGSDRNAPVVNAIVHIVGPEIPATNGVIHVIDTVLAPPTAIPAPHDLSQPAPTLDDADNAPDQNGDDRQASQELRQLP